jgi:hypothetical protein
MVDKLAYGRVRGRGDGVSDLREIYASCGVCTA